MKEKEDVSYGPIERFYVPKDAFNKDDGVEKKGQLFPDKSGWKKVFVIMAFSPDMEPIYEGIEVAAADFRLDAKRVKDVHGDYRITERIMEMIRDSVMVVADLTHGRPNVYFELGYARGIGKPVITIARTDTKIHFDVKDWTYIPYTDSRTLERDLKKRLEKVQN